MNKLIFGLAFVFAASPVFAQSANSDASSAAQSQSGSGATAANGPITFQASEPLKHQSVDTTPTIYTPPSMFGGANNCGQSSTLGVGFTGFGLGGSVASESENCNAREDTSIAYKLGYKDVADMRFFCFGEDTNRKAFEAAGHKCPAGATAKGLTRTASATDLRTAQNNAAVANNTVPLTADATVRRTATNYWGTDPIVMNRLGIPR